MADISAPRRTRDEQRAQTREDLLDAAAEVFALHGYHATSVDMVAEAAGYTKGAVYSNFESKEELFLALLESRLEDTLGSVEEIMDRAAPQDRPQAFADRRDAIPQWQPTWFLLEAEFELYAARNPAVRERVADRQRQTRAIIEEALNRHIREMGLTPAYPVEKLARLIVATGDGLSLMALNNPETDTGDLMRILLEVLARGATADEAGSLKPDGPADGQG
jgi:AcrR family transcriptional regulator